MLASRSRERFRLGGKSYPFGHRKPTDGVRPRALLDTESQGIARNPVDRGQPNAYTAQGHTVGLAQRMEALAESGHICFSENTARLIEGYFELQDLGRTRVKGMSEDLSIFDLRGVGAMRTRLDRNGGPSTGLGLCQLVRGFK